MNLKKKPMNYGEPRIKTALNYLCVLVNKHFSSVGGTQNFKSNLQGDTLQGREVRPGLFYMKIAHVIKRKKNRMMKPFISWLFIILSTFYWV